MPTYNRRPFIPQAIRYFLRQDYPRCELIIVDDGADPIADLVPADPRIRYIRRTEKATVGAKRNLACAAAGGEVIVHWDDDDWYPPWRVRAQVQALRARSADLCGTSQLFYYEPATGHAWRYVYTGGRATWVAGNTLAYRKQFWARNPFPELQIGEDTRFVWSGAPKVVHDLADPSICVGLIHGTNTSAKITSGLYWQAYSPAAVTALLGDDLATYRPAAAPHSPLDAPPAPPLVSCIMPTYNRRAFLPLALAAFAQQDYPNRELIIIDDGPDPVGDLAEGLPGVRYVRCPTRLSVGAKRNLACRHAQGSIIAHWDDDDWYAPRRLRYQAAPLLAGTADLSGLENAFVLELPGGTFWTTGPQLHQRMFVGDVHGGTLMYNRSVLDSGCRYPEINLAEDAALLRQALGRGKRLTRLANAGVFVYVRHGQNAWSFTPGRFLDPTGWTHTDPPPTLPSDVLDSYRRAAGEQ